MTAPTVPTLPPAPSRGSASPDAYVDIADAWAAALPAFGSAVQSVGAFVETQAGGAEAAKNTATSAAGNAQTYASNASASADAASASATSAAGSAGTAAGWLSTSTSSMAIGTGAKSLTIQTAKQFTAGDNIKVKRTSAPTTTYVIGVVSSYNASTGALAFNVGSGDAAGSGTFTDWTVSLSGEKGATGATGTGISPQTTGFMATGGLTTPRTLTVDVDLVASDVVTRITRDARTTNTQLATADKGKLIEITGSGGFTQTFSAASVLGASWFVYYINNSTGDVTLDPNGSETIGGVNAATSLVLKPGQAVLINGDGASFYMPIAPTAFRNMEVFLTSGTFTPKPGVVRYWIEGVAGGGGGGGGPGGGGGAGQSFRGFANITGNVAVTIGAGGGAGGGSGGSTSFGGFVTVTGGGGGALYTGGGTDSGGAGGGYGAPSSVTNGILKLPGANGGIGDGAESQGGTGAPSIYGGGPGSGGNGGGSAVDNGIVIVKW